ncbi:MAG: hypothetical protein EHM21_06065 [Chloroflexi bacterium]|nr:MAG: hypothetical protein EHM21_06065 [Chloroflexota bacterium]
MSFQQESITPQEAMFNEAMSAIQAGDRPRARDLLTRLLKIGQDNPDYWVWMSAVVETSKERTFCLKEALRLNPQHAAARRGLILMGSLPPEESLVLPARYQKRNWQAKASALEGGEQSKAVPKSQFALMGVALVVVLGLIAFAFFGAQRQFMRRTSAPIIFIPSDTPAPTVETTPTALQILSGSPTPLWMILKATYTPTPLYINTPHSSSEAYRIGLRYFGRQDWKNALTYFKQAATAEPTAPDIEYYLGEIHRAQGNYPQALQSYNGVIKDTPGFAPAYLGRARVTLALNEKNVESALIDLQTAIEKDGSYGEAYLGLAELYLQTGENGQALEALEQAEIRMPESPLVFLYRAEAYLALKDAGQALENARRANQLDVTLLPAYRLIGQVLQSNGDLAGSISPLNVYVTYQPDDAQAWAMLANAYLDQKNARDGLKALDQSLRLDNRQKEAYLLRAQLLLDQDKAESALNDFKAASRLDATSYEASLGIGKALMAMKYPGDAYMQFERTKALAQDELQNAEVIFWRAQSLEKLGQLEVAQRDYKALTTLPAGSVNAEWVEYAKERLAAMALLTPSPKPKTATPTITVTFTRQPTKTKAPTATRQPTRTSTPSKTPLPTKTPVPASPTPTR